MAIEIVLETHSTSVDNELGRAVGWSASELSELGRTQAVELGRRRRSDAIAAVFSSDLVRAAQTAAIAFDGSPIPILHDWRLRECDYGQRTGSPAEEARTVRRRVPRPALPRRRKLAAGHRPGRPVSRRPAVALERPAIPGHRPHRDQMGPGAFHQWHRTGRNWPKSTSAGRPAGNSGSLDPRSGNSRYRSGRVKMRIYPRDVASRVVCTFRDRAERALVTCSGRRTTHCADLPRTRLAFCRDYPVSGQRSARGSERNGREGQRKRRGSPPQRRERVPRR